MARLDDLELELRKLPGVSAAGFDEHDDLLVVQLHVTPGRVSPSLPAAATRLAAKHSDKPVAVEVVRWREPAGRTPEATDGGPGLLRRPRLLATLEFADTDECEVHLIHEGRRTIGRAPASRGLCGVAEATVDAVRQLGVDLPASVRWAREVESDNPDVTLVAVALDGVEERSTLHGMAPGASAIEAAARATLDALNRHVTKAR